MKSIIPTESFSAYPDGALTSFDAGEPAEVSDEFAELVVGKGLAREKPPDARHAPSTEEETT